jgi:hypothetical protein
MKLSGSKFVIVSFLLVLSPCSFFVEQLCVSRCSVPNFTVLDEELLHWQNFQAAKPNQNILDLIFNA